MIIDLGCGVLKYPATMDNPHLRFDGVVGVDVCKYANDVVADALNTPFRDEVADTVVMRQFIEHIDALSLIREAWRILKPNGKILIETPNGLWVFRTLRALIGSESNPHKEHIQVFSAPEIRNLFRRNGFRSVEVSYFNVHSNNPNAVLNAVKKLISYVVDKRFPMLDRTLRATALKDASAKFEEY